MPLPLRLLRGVLAGSVPYPTISGLQYRVRADSAYTDSGSTLATALGDRVLQLSDISGNGGHVVARLSTTKPAFIPADGLCGRPAVRLDQPDTTAASACLIAPSGVSVNSRDFTFEAVLRVVHLGADSYGLFNFGSTTTLTNPCAFTNGGGLIARFPGVGNSTARIYGNPFHIAVVGRASSTDFYLNGVKSSVGSAYNAATATGGALFYRGDGYRLRGTDVFEHAQYSAALSDADIASLYAYAKARYSIAESWSNLICIAGDSLAEGELDTDYAKSVPRIVGDALGPTWKASHTVVSGAYVGASGRTMLTSSTDTCDPHVSGISGRKAAVMLGGINDIFNASATASTLQGYVTTWVNARIAAGFNETYVATLAPMGTGSPIYNATKEGHRQTYNTWVRAQAGTLFTKMIDMDGIAGFTPGGNTTYFATDQLHWKQPGRDAVAALVLAQLA